MVKNRSNRNFLVRLVLCGRLEYFFDFLNIQLHRREFNQTQQLRMMVDVALAMKYLVDNGYVHRDLAAKNIMCNAQLKCKIGDFSMAKKLSESQFPHQVLLNIYILQKKNQD